MGLELNISATASYIAAFDDKSVGVAGLLEMVANLELLDAMKGGLNLVLGLAAYSVFGMLWTVIPAAVFWYVSLRFMAARKAKAKLESLPYSEAQAKMFPGSDFDVLAGTRAPQIFFGFLAYIGVVVGIVLHPITMSIVG